MVEIVAEISGNHGGDLQKAIDLIVEAANCGCDYAKFQLYRPEDMPDMMEGDNEAMYRRLAVPDEWLPELFGEAHAACIGLFASVFSVRAAKEILKYDVPYIKIASPSSTRLSYEVYEKIISEIPPLRLLCSVDATWDSHPLRKNARLLCCPPGHPPSEDALWEAWRRFDHIDYYGFSDHTRSGDYWTALRFIEYGAKMVEKHFKIDENCIDAAFSADPETMKLLCKLAHK